MLWKLVVFGNNLKASRKGAKSQRKSCPPPLSGFAPSRETLLRPTERLLEFENVTHIA